ncbi:hypothetical protein FS749_006054, partial [Ceratobasidium sp. UAMH 11750]
SFGRIPLFIGHDAELYRPFTGLVGSECFLAEFIGVFAEYLGLFTYSCSASTPTPPPVPLDPLGRLSGTWSSSQPAPSTSSPSQPTPTSCSISQPNLFSTDSKPPSASRRGAPRETPLRAQTDLPLISGPFITPRDQIGLPRVHPLPSPARCVAGPGRAKGSGTKKEKKQEGEKEAAAERGNLAHDKGDAEPEKDGTARGVSGEQVRVVLVDGHYPPRGLEPGHRRLFGAKNVTEDTGDGEADAGKVGSIQTGPTAPTNNYYRTAGSSNYYRTSNSTDDLTEPPAQPRARHSQKSSSSLRKAPPIPKHSPVAPPPVSRLPMMMTSPIRATGGRESDPELDKGRRGKAQKGKGAKPPEPAPVPPAEQPTRQFPLSLSEYSPLRRLLKNAGVDSLGDVLGQGGVLGLKGDGGWARNGSGAGTSRAGAKAAMIKEQEREVVDLTSDAEEDDMSAPVKAPALRRRHRPVSNGFIPSSRLLVEPALNLKLHLDRLAPVRIAQSAHCLRRLS